MADRGAGGSTESINPWGLALFRTLETVDPDTATEQSAFDSWLEQTSAREEARRDRLHAAEGIVPPPLARPVLVRGGDLPLHALLRRQWRTRRGPGDARGLRHRGDRGVAAPPLVLNRPFEQGLPGAGPSRCNDRWTSSAPHAMRLASRTSLPAMRREARCERHSKERSTADRTIDTLAAMLLALAAVATAWSSYQASRWTGEQAKAFGAANAARVESTRASTSRTHRLRSTCPSSRSGSTPRSATRRSSRRSTSSGSATSSSPPSRRGSHRPVQRPLGTSVPLRDARIPTGRDQRGGRALGDRRGVSVGGPEYIQRATNYVLGVVLFATSLFFAGISTKLNSTRLRGSSSASDASCSSRLPRGSRRSRSACRSEWDRLAPLGVAVASGPDTWFRVHWFSYRGARSSGLRALLGKLSSFSSVHLTGCLQSPSGARGSVKSASGALAAGPPIIDRQDDCPTRLAIPHHPIGMTGRGVPRRRTGDQPLRVTRSTSLALVMYSLVSLVILPRACAL